MAKPLYIQHMSGDPDLCQVILVHGAMDRSSTMRTLARLLQPHPVVFYDRRGYGRSNPGEKAGVRSHVNDLAQLASGKRTVIFGHSLGGAYALALASSQQRPKELLGVSVFEAPLPGLNWWGDWEIPRESAACGDFEPELAHRIAKEFMIQSIGESAWNSLPEKTKALRQKEGTTLLIELAQLHLSELRIDFSQLDLPLQWGISQKIGPRHLASYDKVKNILDATFYCVPGAGHGAHITHPQALAQALHQLLETVSKS